MPPLQQSQRVPRGCARGVPRRSAFTDQPNPTTARRSRPLARVEGQALDLGLLGRCQEPKSSLELVQREGSGLGSPASLQPCLQALLAALFTVLLAAVAKDSLSGDSAAEVRQRCW